MKKIIPFILFLVLTAAACGQRATPLVSAAAAAHTQPLPTQATAALTPEITPTPKRVDGMQFSLLEEGANYKVYAGEEYYYEYIVYDNAGRVIDFGNAKQRGVEFTENGNFLELCIPQGTYAFYVRYYNLEKSLVSRFYEQPLKNNGKNVVYFGHEDNNIVLIMESLFCPGFKKSVKGDFSFEVLNQYCETEFLSDAKIKITYLAGENREEVTEVIDFAALG